MNITLKYVALHKQYADTIYKQMKLATVQPTMVNAPLWWIDPTDTVAQTIDSGTKLFVRRNLCWEQRVPTWRQNGELGQIMGDLTLNQFYLKSLNHLVYFST